MMATTQPESALAVTRGVHPAALPPALVHELRFVLNSLAVVGYRPHVQSLTLYDLVLACPQLLPAIATARQLIWDAVEAQFGLECCVWPETTSLISWTAGASIGWHHDANRPYLAARHISAVAYLSTQGRDFEGGTFCFQSGPEPLRVQPCAGMLLLYTSDDRSVHCVEEVTSGERCTLTMWFTLDPEHSEDKKVLSKLHSCQRAGLPPTMYQLPDGLDIRVLRLQQRLQLTIITTHQPQQSSGPQGDPQAHSAHTTQQQPAQQQEQYYVQCMMHGTPEGQLGCKRVPRGCTSLQEAVMVVCMAEWLVAAEASGPGGSETSMFDRLINCSSNAQQSSRAAVSCEACEASSAALPSTADCLTAGAPWCSACALLGRLGAASLVLQAYLQDAECVLQQLLPTWVQLEALVPPRPCQ